MSKSNPITNFRFCRPEDLWIGTEEVVRLDSVGVAVEAPWGKKLPRTRTGTYLTSIFTRPAVGRYDILHICDPGCCVSIIYQIHVRHVSAIGHSLSRAWDMIGGPGIFGISSFNTNTFYS